MITILVVKTHYHFNLCIKFVACGATFRMVFHFMDCTKGESSMSVLGRSSDVVASKYTFIVLANTLQIHSNAIQQTWSFTLAFDGSTHKEMSYLNVQT